MLYLFIETITKKQNRCYNELMSFAHIDQIIKTTLPVQSGSLPVYGNFYTALLGLAFILILIGIAYFVIGRLPLSKKDKLTPRKEIFLAKTITALILFAITSAAWDIWWHRAVGRDSLWEPPHLFLYSFAGLAILLGIYSWHRTHKKIWKKIASALFLIPASLPFDNFWHILYGVEDLSRPISLSWSPPHVLLAIGAVIALFMLIPVLMHE